MKKVYLSLLALLFIAANTANAQLLDPNQPEQDACGAIILCGNSFFTPYSYQGTGLVEDMNLTPCLAGEGNSVWLKLVVTSGGSIVFTITPQDETDDYDFAVMNVTGIECSNIPMDSVIRCNFNNNLPPITNNGIVGLSATATNPTVGGGATGQPFAEQIIANTGDVYLIMINNFGSTGGPSSGFTIDFSGSTATFNNNGTPTIDSYAASCDYTAGLSLHLSQLINCPSIASDGSDFYLTPSGTVSSAVGVNCNADNEGYTDNVNVTFNPPLPPGTYTLHVQNGTDGNTLTDLCGEQMSETESVVFTIIPPITYQSVSLSCTTITVHTNIPVKCNSVATNGSDFLLPSSGLNIINAEPLNCENNFTSDILLTLDGVLSATASYSLNAQNGSDGNSLIDSCDNQQAIGSSLQFNADIIGTDLNQLSVDLGNDITICEGDSVFISADIEPLGEYQYHWSPNGMYFPQNTPNIIYYGDTDITLKLFVIPTSGCGGMDSVKIFVQPLLSTFANTNDTGLCLGSDSIQLNITGGVSYQWTPSEGLSNDTIANPKAYPLWPTDYRVIITGSSGCKDTQDIKVNVYPQAVVNLPDSVQIYPGESYQMNPEGNCLYFNWFPPSGLSSTILSNPIAQPEVRTRYFVTATTEYGCSVEDSIDVLVEGTVVDLPNVFTPGNGINNIFKPVYRGVVKLNSFTIYNRWGQQVFTSTDINKGWDGTFNDKPQPMGVYVYEIDATTDSGKHFIKQGNFSLLR